MSRPEDTTQRAPEDFLGPPTNLGIPVRVQLGDSATVASNTPGRQLTGRYAVVKEIGRGGMGVVYRAFDRDLRRHVAMKVLGARLAGDSDCLGRFVEEAQATGQLEHPGIVPVYEIGRDPQGQLFFTMKLVRGRTLAQLVSDLRAGDAQTRERFNLFRLMQIFSEVCRTVHYAHERGVIHRDLKPGNVMVGRHGDVQVMDWGLVKVVEREEPRQDPTMFGSSQEVSLDRGRNATGFGSLLGTPAYMAPEQADATGDPPGPRSDVYALGAILYHLLTGRPPFVEPTTRATVAALLHDPPPRLRSLEPTVPPELEAICLWALEKEPEKRYPTAEALADDVQAFLEGRPVRALPLGRVGRLRKFCRREPVKAGLFGLLLLAVVGMAGALGLMLREQLAKEQEAEEKRQALATLRLETTARERAFAELQKGYTQLADLSLIEVFYARLPLANTLPAERLRWLADYRALLGRRKDHAQALSTVESTLTRSPPDSLSLRQKQLDLSRLLKEIDELDGFALRLELPPPPLDSLEVQARWDVACRAIADTLAYPAYAGLRLAPFVDLVPIGPDPQSGLWEFAHTWSGTVPLRDEAGKFAMAETTSIVFVLIPGGSFQMGSATGDDDEQPVHTVHLSPFLLSKYEVTQAQWQLLCGETPSWYTNERHNVTRFTRTQPVESVSWIDCEWVAELYGLVLPTEAQWEYASRAGTTSAWWLGDDESAVARAANVIDGDDGFHYTAPVGSYPPNPWGLYDTIGNVWEWCRDHYPAPYSEQERWDPLVTPPDATHRFCRGGSWVMPAEFCRSAKRLWESKSTLSGDFGFRPARELPTGAR